MDTKDFQNMSVEIVEKIDKKYNIKRDPHFSFTQLMEEVGELARAINLPKLRNKKLDQENLEDEFADVFLQLAILAKIHNIDFKKAVESKIKKLKIKHKIK